MNRGARTPPRDLATAVKRALRLSLELAKHTQHDLGIALGEHDALVKAWCDDARCNAVPMWILSAPTLPRAVRELLMQQLEDLAGLPKAPPAAHTPEAQVNVASGRLGALLAAASEAMLDGTIDPSEARALLPVVQKAIDTLSGLRDHLLRVVGESTTEVGDA